MRSCTDTPLGGAHQHTTYRVADATEAAHFLLSRYTYRLQWGNVGGSCRRVILVVVVGRGDNVVFGSNGISQLNQVMIESQRPLIEGGEHVSVRFRHIGRKRCVNPTFRYGPRRWTRSGLGDRPRFQVGRIVRVDHLPSVGTIVVRMAVGRRAAIVVESFRILTRRRTWAERHAGPTARRYLRGGGLQQVRAARALMLLPCSFGRRGDHVQSLRISLVAATLHSGVRLVAVVVVPGGDDRQRFGVGVVAQQQFRRSIGLFEKFIFEGGHPPLCQFGQIAVETECLPTFGHLLG